MAFKKTSYLTGENARINTVEPIRSKNDIKRIMQFFDDKGWHKYTVIFYLGIKSGLRISDVLGFKVQDVRNKTKVALREQKTGKTKFFPVDEKLQDMLNDWCKDKPDEAWLFEGRKDKKLDRSQVYRRINDACLALKIDANVGTHTLRKTFGYHHFRQFNNITLLQQIFNHTSPDVTKRYIGITQDEIDTTYLSLDLSKNPEDLESVSTLKQSRSRARAGASFCKNYIKNTGGKGKYVEFAKILLEILTASKFEEIEKRKKDEKLRGERLLYEQQKAMEEYKKEKKRKPEAIIDEIDL